MTSGGVFDAREIITRIRPVQHGAPIPASITIDEALGQMIPLFLLKPSFVLLAAAFFLFRFFDIIKPFPVNRAERLSSGWGIMLDDVVAGLFSGILLNIYLLIR